MKKKNLIILLLIPFLIALLGVVTLNTTFNVIDNDIVAIEWDYEDVEAFKLSSSLIPLNATGVNQKNYPAGAGNALTWTVTNEDPDDTNVYAENALNEELHNDLLGYYDFKDELCSEIDNENDEIIIMRSYIEQYSRFGFCYI